MLSVQWTDLDNNLYMGRYIGGDIKLLYIWGCRRRSTKVIRNALKLCGFEDIHRGRQTSHFVMVVVKVGCIALLALSSLCF